MRDRDWVGVAAVAWVIGLLSLLCDHFELARPLIFNMHLLFATVTCCAIAAVLFEKARASVGLTEDELYLHTRRISRWVYILMYLLALVRLCLCWDTAYPHCGPCVARPEATRTESLEDFQFYIACCVIPLWLARAAILAGPFKTSERPLQRDDTLHTPRQSGVTPLPGTP